MTFATPTPRPRVVVTGLGMSTAAGRGVGAAWSLLERGETALNPVQGFDPSPYGLTVAGEAQYLDRGSNLDRGLQLLDQATEEVLADAGWGPDQQGPQTAVVLGTCQGSIDRARGIHEGYARRPQPAPSEADRIAFANYRPGAATARLADQIGAEGPTSTVGMVCVSSSVALIHAMDLLHRGECTRVVAGGFEEFSQFVFTGFFCIGALGKELLMPFDAERDGTVLGEGAVLLTLETLESAQARGATIHAELVGGGFAADAFHMTAPDPEGRGLERAIRQAFGQAGLGPADIDYISAHGTGTVFNDAMECKAFARIFAELASMGRMPPISGAKAVFGHTLGAAGALDAVVSILALKKQMVPPTVSHQESIEDWDFVPGAARSASEALRVSLSTNSAFGGNNSALLLRSWEGSA